MNKNELVSAVADKANLSKGDAQSAVDAVFSVITEELKKGGDVRLVGFGNFSVSRREASTGRNPQTGAEVKIPARNVPKFSARSEERRVGNECRTRRWTCECKANRPPGEGA